MSDRHGGSGRDGVELAGFGARLLAQVIDLLWLLPASILLDVVAVAVNGGPMSVGGEIMANVIGALLVLLFWVERQATPGKMALGLRIVDAGDGGPPGLRQYVMRYVGYLVAAIPFGLGFLWIIWDPRRQGWHDKLARTLVVRVR